MRAFCKSLNQRINGGGLKKLTIEITKTESTGALEPLASLVPASANGFAGILDLFRRYLGNVQGCEIKLPEWTTKDHELMELVEETRTTVCLPWGTTDFEQTVGEIGFEESQVAEAAYKETELQEAESPTTQVQEEVLRDTKSHATDLEDMAFRELEHGGNQGQAQETAQQPTPHQPLELTDETCPSTDDQREQQSLESSPEWSFITDKELFEKQKHEEWDDWYESGDCSCYECPHISEGRWSVSEDGLGG